MSYGVYQTKIDGHQAVAFYQDCITWIVFCSLMMGWVIRKKDGNGTKDLRGEFLGNPNFSGITCTDEGQVIRENLVALLARSDIPRFLLRDGRGFLDAMVKEAMEDRIARGYAAQALYPVPYEEGDYYGDEV